MRESIRRLVMALVTGAALLASLFGCMQETPFYEPQRYPQNGPGPSGTAAFTSGEASKTGLKPVKEGARDSDIFVGQDAAGTTDVSTTPEVQEDVKQPPQDTGGPGEPDFGFPT